MLNQPTRQELNELIAGMRRIELSLERLTESKKAYSTSEFEIKRSKLFEHLDTKSDYFLTLIDQVSARNYNEDKTQKSLAYYVKKAGYQNALVKEYEESK
jgi:hypothetical protein